MILEVEAKLKRKNKILFSRESECLQPLLELISKQKHRVVVLWAFDCIQIPLNQLKKKYPQENRLQIAYLQCVLWAQGKIKMPIAKRAILNAHQAAKEMIDPIDVALCHAVAQGLSSVHVETHAIGLPFYELSAIVLNNENYDEKVIEKVDFYMKRLEYWQQHYQDEPREWASFLMNDSRINREYLLRHKEKPGK